MLVLRVKDTLVALGTDIHLALALFLLVQVEELVELVVTEQRPEMAQTVMVVLASIMKLMV